ncbi:L-fucose kinase-like isoform X1 [Hydractinia symbiolongicarpus]|uniref:L-fucose kinase-like isoform X1 n=1 Tax=Hydractinia symbiolongicarpus TaxID=13093 RepID=UPI00255114B2|nr:L-fucose kinase-like isoform X1 [Hydractinia symbiolongicarpus]XP_057317334.1 L-fucose kinase-like isoform X1 [Hydractinia symbiolongicarpus]
MSQEKIKMEKIWTAIVITCSDQESAHAFKLEIELRQRKLLIHPETLILCVVDPKPNIGSGGATLNAVLHVTEHISALQGYTVISSDVLQNKRILILHMGTTTPYSACSPGFLPLPAFIENVGSIGSQYSGLATQFDVLLQMTINVLAKDSPYGFWVCSCDRLITISSDTKVDWSTEESAVYLFGVPVEIPFAANQHGVIKIGEKNAVEDIIYKGSAETISHCKLEDGNVPAVSGLVFFKTNVADALLNISVSPPLDICTYLGLDAGSRPSQFRPLASDVEHVYRDKSDIVLSLFFDVLLCMASNIEKKDYVGGERSGVYGTVHFPDMDRIDASLRVNARQVLWETLSGISMKAELLHNSEFHYLSHDPSRIHQLLLNCPYKDPLETSFASIKFRKRASSLSLTEDIKNEKNIVAVNTMVKGATVGDNCVLLHSYIEGDVNIGSNSLIVNIQPSDLEPLQNKIYLPDDIVFESLHLKMESETGTVNTRILLMFGIHDRLQKPFSMPESTVFNVPWETFFARTTIQPAELWSPELPLSKRCFLNARLFPVYHPRDKVNVLHFLWMHGSYKDKMFPSIWRSCWRLSLLEILDLTNPEEEFAWRRQLFFNIGQRKVEKSLHNRKDNCFMPFFQTCIMDGYFEDLLTVLDNIIMRNSNHPAIISRTFACIADVLGAKANGQGGLRSGPAANYSWKKGLDMIRNERIQDAVQFMANQRKLWFISADLLVRAARHYEGAFQIQVRKAVATARQFIKLTRGEPVALNTWVTAEAPARCDIAGTWSDTPPICYEHSGAVVTIAINVDSKKPIGCRVQRIPEYKIVLILGKENPIKIVCTEFSDLLNYSQPNTPGALLKAAFFCSELLPLTQHRNLAKYLKDKHSSGFVLQTWSNLPHGSGLGTSSILAGSVLSALWTAAGMKHDVSSVLHAVLDLEQMLTTGGGWQDQVGGLCPGIKIGSSKNQLPLHIKTEQIQVPDGFKETLENHLLVVFTGKTRLARNMLQDVLRNWNARFPEIVETASELVKNAENAKKALEEGKLELIGQYLNECWRHKKSMAHGCEPSVCRAIMDQLEPLVHGQCLAGAGGGGFMYVITKDEFAMDKIKAEIEKVEMATKASVHYAQIDREGLVVKIADHTNNDSY